MYIIEHSCYQVKKIATFTSFEFAVFTVISAVSILCEQKSSSTTQKRFTLHSLEFLSCLSGSNAIKKCWSGAMNDDKEQYGELWHSIFLKILIYDNWVCAKNRGPQYLRVENCPQECTELPKCHIVNHPLVTLLGLTFVHTAVECSLAGIVFLLCDTFLNACITCTLLNFETISASQTVLWST